MKRILFLLLTILALCGCGKTEPATPTTAPVPVPTEPPGSYAQNSAVEQYTGGDVRAYPQSIPDIYAVACAGEDVLVFSGKVNTTVTRLTGENLYRIGETELETNIYPDDVTVQVTEDRLVYYVPESREMVYLDDRFREVQRICLPESIQGAPALSEDLRSIWYFQKDGLRVLDTDSGRSRLVTEMAYPTQMVLGVLMEGTVVRCSIMDPRDIWYDLYIDADTGEVLCRKDDTVWVRSGGGLYYGTYYEDDGQVLLFGREGEKTRALQLNTFGLHIFSQDRLVLTESYGEDFWKLDLYDLDSGLRTAGIPLPEDYSGWGFCWDSENRRVYFHGYGEAESQIIYRWDVEKSPTFDEQTYTDTWYTLEAPDYAGLAECENRAEAMSQRFGLDIRIWERAVEVQPWDYDMTPEHRVPVITKMLDKLEYALGQFPEGFLPLILESLEGGTLRLSLVQKLTGSAETGSLDSANGIQFWQEEDAYIAMIPGDDFLPTFFHELFHTMEMRILSKSILYYRWDELNPPGFEYDYDYVANQERDDWEYLDDSTRAFIDLYSMSFPKEDRARIFEKACLDGNEAFFQSETMQQKLKLLCSGIRDAYDLNNTEITYLWEQYLTE